MISKTFPLVIVFGLMLPLMATQVAAQTELVADIPFAFSVCHEQLPAGKYHVRRVTSASANMVLIGSEGNRSIDIACTHDVQSQKAATTGKLIFNRYGDQYFLSEIWSPGNKTGNQLPPTEKEKALRLELRGGKKREKVIIKITESKP